MRTVEKTAELPFDIREHVHRLAAWAASTAASSAKGKRFKVATGCMLIERIGLKDLVGLPEKLPGPDNMDAAHLAWRSLLIQTAHDNGLSFFTHGLAAKLINMYLKVAFVNTAYAELPQVMALHPPIDRELLSGLAKSSLGTKRTWCRFRDMAWSSFDADTYQAVIDAMRQALPPNQALWTIEEHWKGYQEARSTPGTNP